MTNDTQQAVKTFSAMQEGRPVATYKKTILGKVFLNILDPFTDKPTGILLSGDNQAEDAKIEVWSVKEDLFLRRMNRSVFERGVVKKVEDVVEEKSAVFTDAELKDILALTYISLQKRLVEIDDAAVLTRLSDLAKELEKTEKIQEVVNNRLHTVLSVEG